MIFRLAIRNLFRNRWRSALTVGGIAVATGMLTWTMAMMDGMEAAFIRGATAVELGQVQVHRADYAERSSIYKAFPESDALLSELREVPRVTGAAGRCHVYGLVGHERRSQVARIVGISPLAESRVTLLDEALTSGRWLSEEPPDYPAPREVLVASDFAELLEVEVGDELVVFLQAADGSLGNDLLEVTGILRTGNSIIDRTTVYMNLADVQVLAALEGRVHEIALGVDELMLAREVAASASDVVEAHSELAGPEEDQALIVRAWQEILPDLSTLLELYDRSVWITFLIVFVIVALGILNTQRMSALERRREFGVLMAVGLTPRKLGRMIVVETVALTLIGAGLGAVGGTGLSLHHASAGFDMSAFSDQASFSMMGVAFSERLYFEVTAASVYMPLVWTVVVAILCGLWPALASARLNVPQAISGRTD